MKEIWLLDITAWAFRAIFAAPPLSNSRGVPTGGVYLFAKMMLAFIEKYKPQYICAVWDAKTRSFRKDLSPTYKAGRPPLEPHFKSQLKLCRAIVRALPLPVLEVAGCEADDTLATLAHESVRHGFDVIVASPDKDLQVLISDHIRIYNPQKEIWVTETIVQEKWGVNPHQISDLLTLTGDPTDNIKGVEGIGPKTAAKLLLEHGHLNGVINNADKVTGKRGVALRLAISDGSLELSRKLVSLKDDVELPIGPHEMRTPEPNLVTREFLFKHLEFYSLLPSDAMPTLSELTPTFDAQGRRI